MAVVAKALNKPFYVAVESYKFARLYPITSRDIKDLCERDTRIERSGDKAASTTECERKDDYVDVPSVDFTPSEFITLLFTDIGVLTPAAVSDELIRMYQ